MVFNRMLIANVAGSALFTKLIAVAGATGQSA
jgi:hypothetical protein